MNKNSQAAVAARRATAVKMFNQRIEESGSSIRLVEQSYDGLLFSNGKRIEYNSAFYKSMLRYFHSPSYQTQLSRLGDLLDNWKGTAKEIAFSLHSKGGKKAQALHGDEIIKNNLTAHGQNKGITGPASSSYGRKLSEDLKKRLSESHKGAGNPMYGKHHDDAYKKAKSEYMKRMILQGNFTPNTNNRLTHYDIVYQGVRYRSSWEVLFAATHKNFEYEKLRIPYQLNETSHVYIVDFVDHQAKIAVEIKPYELLNKHNNNVKIDALKEQAKQAGYTVQVLMQNDIVELAKHTDLTIFDDKTREKLETLIKNEVSFNQRNFKAK